MSIDKNQNVLEKYNLYLDNIVFSLQNSGGISVVWYELLKRLLNSSCKVRVIEYENAVSNNIFRRDLNIKKEIILSKKASFLKLRRYFNPKIKCDDKFIFHSSYYRTNSNPKSINVTTVHDFTYEKFSKGIRKWIHSRQKIKAIKKSDRIICISENTKTDLLNFIPEINKDKIKVIYNGVSEEYFVTTELNGYILPFPKNTYVLFVGSREVHKNFNLVIESLSHTPHLNLVIVGKMLSEEETLFVESKIGKRYKCLSRIPNEELNKLYNHAYCFLYPSIYEGFGIPVVEAQKAGCPVIAYNGSSIPEVIGETPLLIDELKTESIVKCLELLNKEKEREEIIVRGIENSQRFSWEKNYMEMIELYKEALSNCY